MMSGEERLDIDVEYCNILADITIGKNLEKHYYTITKKIESLNQSIDKLTILNSKNDGFVGVCYHYYKLKDLVISKIQEKSMNL
jgi:hypothetical protein